MTQRALQNFQSVSGGGFNSNTHAMRRIHSVWSRLNDDPLSVVLNRARLKELT